MKCLVGLGSNLGDRRHNLERAAKVLVGDKGVTLHRVSPVVETPALVPEGAPLEWNISFLNAVIEIDWTGSAEELLRLLKTTEANLGRELSERWAPRLIDLDLLTYGDLELNSESLRIPHPGMWERQFVLVPLKHLNPSYKLTRNSETVLERSRKLGSSIPLWMGILNLTPDSFSDGGSLNQHDEFERRVASMDLQNVNILDIGGESTRPGATPLSSAEEWARLAPALEVLTAKLHSRIFRPLISIDTYHAATAERALAMGADLINDVSGLSDPAMLPLLRESKCQYVLMHSLSIPADPRTTMDDGELIHSIKDWARRKIDLLTSQGVDLDRIIFDPGIGFGKTPQQSHELIRQVDRFLDLPVRLLIGHSRKSFLSRGGKRSPDDRDFETLGVSLRLAERGADILRVHTPEAHQRVFHSFQGAQ